MYSTQTNTSDFYFSSASAYRHINYSLLKLFTGFATAPFIV